MDALKLSEHAVERMAERNVTRVDVRNALDDHKPFWSREERTCVAVGNAVGPEARVGAAVNVEDQVVTTVMHMPKTDADLLAETINKGPYKGERRYREIRLDDD